MRCDQFENRLNDVLDRRDDPRRDAPLIAHAATCRECRNLAAAYEVLTDGASELRNSMSITPVKLPNERSTPWLALAPLLATAAAAMFLLSRPAAKNEVPTAHAPTTKMEPVLAVVSVPTPTFQAPSFPIESEPSRVVGLARTTGRAYVGLIHGTARSLDDALALASTLPPAQRLLQPVLFPEDGLLRRMEDRFAPVAGETIDALRQVFESPESQQL